MCPRPYAHSNPNLKSLKPTFKLFPSVCALQILWKFVSDCWSEQAETAVEKASGLNTWDYDVTMVG